MIRPRMRTLISSALLLSVVSLFAVNGQAAGDSALVTAAREGDVRAVRALIAKKADVNEPARDGSTPLLWAIYHSDLEMARLRAMTTARQGTALDLAYLVRLRREEEATEFVSALNQIEGVQNVELRRL